MTKRDDHDAWSRATDRIGQDLSEIEQSLIYQADLLAQEANDHIREAVRLGAKNGGLGMTARQREGRWGCRLVWVRGQYVNADKRPDLLRRIKAGTVNRYTKEISLQNGLYTRTRSFQMCSEPLLADIIEFEARAVPIRRAVRGYSAMAQTLKEFPCLSDLTTPHEPRKHAFRAPV